MKLSLAITHIHPTADPLRDFIIQDDSDGRGPYLAAWHLPVDPPTDQELAKAWAAIAPGIAWDQARQERAPLLEAADLAILKAEDTGADVVPLRAYRQALRDITKGPDPYSVTWPTQP